MKAFANGWTKIAGHETVCHLHYMVRRSWNAPVPLSFGLPGHLSSGTVPDETCYNACASSLLCRWVLLWPEVSGEPPCASTLRVGNHCVLPRNINDPRPGVKKSVFIDFFAGQRSIQRRIQITTIAEQFAAWISRAWLVCCQHPLSSQIKIAHAMRFRTCNINS